MACTGALDEFEQRLRHFLAVDYKHTVEYFMPAMFAVDLGETEHFAVGQLAAKFLRQLFEVCHLLITQSKSFFGIESIYIVDFHHRRRLLHGVEHINCRIYIYAFEHGIECRFLAIGHTAEHLYSAYTRKTHILGYLHGIGAPWADHLFSRTDESSF